MTTLETKSHPLITGQFSCRFLCASASITHQTQSLKELQASKLLLPFPLNSPSDSSFRVKLLILSLNSKDLFRSCWVFIFGAKIDLAISDLHEGILGFLSGMMEYY